MYKCPLARQAVTRRRAPIIEKTYRQAPGYIKTDFLHWALVKDRGANYPRALPSQGEPGELSRRYPALLTQPIETRRVIEYCCRGL